MASITVNTNGQTLTVNASISHWTSAALAVVASGDDDIPSTTTTTIGSAYTMHFANTATTVTVTVKQVDGTVLFAQELQCSPAVGPRTLNPAPTAAQVSADSATAAQLALAPTGALAETFSRISNYSLNSAALTSGTMHMTAIYLAAGTTVTSISYMSMTQAAVSPTAWWFALYNSSRELLEQTADQEDAAWAANTVKTVPLADPYVTTYSGLHYLAICVVAGTVPSLVIGAGTNVVISLAPILAGNSTTGLTTTAPATGAALSGGAGTQPYAYVK